MILVTLGTQDKPFDRLLAEVERLIETGVIRENVLVQAGTTRYVSEKMQICDLLSMEELEKRMEECTLLITHGGVGSIISAVRKKKTVIAVPRLAQYGEHVNDHQKQIIREFGQRGCILPTEGVEELAAALEKAKTFVPAPYESNTAHMIALVRTQIEEL